MFYKNYRKAGFTLMELLVVIAIITILAAALMPALNKAWNRGAYGSWTQQKNAIKGDVNCAAYFTFEEGPGAGGSIPQINIATSNLAYAYNPDPRSGFIPDPPTDATLTSFSSALATFPTYLNEWNVNNSRFRGLKYGLRFNSSTGHSTDYVTCGNNQRFDMNGTNLTVEAWINPGSPLQAGGIVSKAAVSSPNDNYYLSINASGQIIFYAVGTLLTTSAPVTTGGWNHIVGTYDGTNLNVYCNGVPIAPSPQSQAGNLVASDGALEIGRQGTSYFKGVIDEVAIYNIALSPEEIFRHYQSGNR